MFLPITAAVIADIYPESGITYFLLGILSSRWCHSELISSLNLINIPYRFTQLEKATQISKEFGQLFIRKEANEGASLSYS